MAEKKWFWACILLASALIFVVSRNRATETESSAKYVPKIAFIVGGPDSFWNVVIEGAKQSAKDHEADLTVIIPEEGGTDQTAKLATINPENYQGIAISPLEPQPQTQRISVLASQTVVVTFDNDAAESSRHCHVGTNNYIAGRQCGELIKQALPSGGKIALFVGDNSRENAILRRQGLVDALRNERRAPGVDLDPIDRSISADTYMIVETYLDGNIPAKAKQNASQALVDHPDLDCMVGLYGYNGPKCLEALDAVNRLGEVVVVAFDEHQETLEGIAKDHVFATVVQDPFQYGYESVRILVGMSNSKDHAIPIAGKGTLYLPCTSVKKENLSEFKARLASRLPKDASQ